MNRRTALLVVVAVAAVGAAVVVGVVGPPDLGGGRADAAEAPRLVYDGERLTVESAPEQTIHGETDLDAGTELAVRLRSTGENPFLTSTTATVDDDGAFEATVDTSHVRPGTTFEVVVLRNGTAITNATGEVVS